MISAARFFCNLILLSTVPLLNFAQSKTPDKYPSLLWEITGKGLKQPSYLFGTMHVSNKMVFNLGDSFYRAIRSVETVALELDADSWQEQMVHYDELKTNYYRFSRAAGNEFITQKSFRIGNYIEELKLAMQTEPTAVNNLLYRSYKVREDFEEDTFLDLYIFQTGKKLGKKSAGVENYVEAEKMMMEAYAEMAKEKKKKNIDWGDESMSDISEKIENAYRRGDLELMDSLDDMLNRSDAFREIFLFKRNEVQAKSMDSIMQNSSLFVGVGAAHLPGKRGVIEILRNMGYTLRPVKMVNRNESEKTTIDKLKVPVTFQSKQSADGFYNVDVPGKFYETGGDYYFLDREQYADMANGSYYLVTRVKTFAFLMGETNERIMAKVDSLLYENIPGKIQQRKEIEKNGFKGYDISSKTRRGDLQRYQIFITPFEVIIFKMSGKENYVDGPEAERFFGSIRLKPYRENRFTFVPAQGGFEISLPHDPLASFANDRWQYMAADATNDNAYLLMKRGVYNFDFIGEDSFDLNLLEESFRNPELFDSTLSRAVIVFNGMPALRTREKLKNGLVLHNLFLINGPHTYVISMKAAGKQTDTETFFKSFALRPYRYRKPEWVVDTFLQARVYSPIVPTIDDDMRRLEEAAAENASNGNNASGYFKYWPKARYGVFSSDTTGEMIMVKVQEYPKYFHIRDSAKYWKNEVDDFLNNGDMLLMGKPKQVKGDGYYGIEFAVKDTGSVRIQKHRLLVSNNRQYSLSAQLDTMGMGNPFITGFFESFKPSESKQARNMKESRLKLFFDDLFSNDSATRQQAYQSLSSVYFGYEGVAQLDEAYRKLNRNHKDYVETKLKMIAEFGYIKDSFDLKVTPILKRIYEETADTSLFQNEAVEAMARLKTKSSYQLLKNILLKDPVIYENRYNYNDLFSLLDDSLQLSAGLFPELLQLTTLDDYKEKVIDLLATLVDSGKIKPQVYEAYVPNIYIDANVTWKKQKAKDEIAMKKAMKKETDENDDDEPVRLYNNNNRRNSPFENYSILLASFVNKNANIRTFFNRQLASQDEYVRMNAAVILARNKQPVPDSIFRKLAADDRYRSLLYTRLEKAKRLDLFPKDYLAQPLIARSFLVEKNRFDKMDSLVFLSTQTVTLKGKKGLVYQYKYRVKKTDQWKIGFSGLQPMDAKQIGTKDEMTDMTDVKIKDDEPIEKQYQQQLKKILFGLHKSGKHFYSEYGAYRVGEPLRF